MTRKKKARSGRQSASMPEPPLTPPREASGEGGAWQAGACGAPAFRPGLAHYFLFLVLFLVLAVCYRIVAPYLDPILLAVILAIVFKPAHSRILRLTGSRGDLAAFLSCLALTLVVVLPLFLLLLSLIRQGIHSFNAIHDWLKAGEYEKLAASPLVTEARALLEPYLPEIKKLLPNLGEKSFSLSEAALRLSSGMGKFLVSQGGSLAGDIGDFIGKSFLMLFTFFFVVRDEERMFRRLLHLVPLSASHEEQIFARVKAVSRSVLLGTLITAIAQGAAGGLAFRLTGLPGLFWGTMMAFASLVPFVGTALIWAPAAGYLLLTGHLWAGAFMVGWCVVVVGMLDNVVRPLFMQGGASMSTLAIFFAILGGINAFGIIGLLYGPLLFGLAMVLLYIYELELEPFLSHQDRS